MPKLMKILTAVSFVLTVTMSILYLYLEIAVFLTLAITFGTIFFHLAIRLVIAFLFNRFMRNKADYTKKWYKVHKWEQKLFKILRVNKWKGKIPTYYPSLYSTTEHTYDEIAQTMCQAELSHETNCVVSFLPLIASIWFGDFWVFFITSICAALFDLVFVIVQRYNRPRVIKLAEHQKRFQQTQDDNDATTTIDSTSNKAFLRELPEEQIIEMMYHQPIDSEYEKVLYSPNRRNRIVIYKDNGIYSYECEKLTIFDDHERQYTRCYAIWEPYWNSGGTSKYDTLEHLLTDIAPQISDWEEHV